MRLTSMSKTAAASSMWRTTIERLRRHIAEMVELAGAARRLDPYAQTAGGCAPSGAAAQVVLSLLQTSRGMLVRFHQTLKVFPAWPLAYRAPSGSW